MEFLALIIAGLSLAISAYATYVAKTAPARERTRAIRDEVRHAVREVSEQAKELKHSLAFGEPAGEPPRELDAALNVIRVHQNRVPEYLTMVDLHLTLGKLERAWKSAHSAQGSLEFAEDCVAEWEDKASEGNEHSRNVLKKYREEVKVSTRRRDAAISDLRDTLNEAQTKTAAYIARHDAEDRREAK